MKGTITIEIDVPARGNKRWFLQWLQRLGGLIAQICPLSGRVKVKVD